MLEISHRTRLLVSLALATAVLSAGAAGLLPAGPALFAGASFALLAAAAAAREHREAARRRAAADDLLACIPSDKVPGRLRWRAEELTSVEERRRLARALRSLVKACESPLAARRAPVPLDWRTIRGQRRAVEELARLLADTAQPVTPRGILLVRRLMLDSLESPLFGHDRADELAATLARARAALSRRKS